MAGLSPPFLYSLGTPRFILQFDWQKYGSDRSPLHAPTTVVWLLRPELFSGLHVNVEIETTSPPTTGMTVIDWWSVTNRQKNAYVVRDVDSEGF